MFTDSPITKLVEDQLGRSVFAKHLANRLCISPESPSIVIGIEGPWGLGKTSCINLVREHLESFDSKPIIVDFNPWIISSLDSVIEGFLLEMASAIGTQASNSQYANKVAASIFNFMNVLTPIKFIPGAEPWFSILKRAAKKAKKTTKSITELTDMSLASKKEKIQNELSKFDRSIVVIIDDIDRLPPEQVRTVFKLIKAVCDFQGVSYLISYDPSPVCSALSFNKQYDGRLFLDKFVQSVHTLPRFAMRFRWDIFYNGLNDIIKETGFDFNEFEDKLLAKSRATQGFTELLNTPRDIYKLLNKIRFTVECTKCEVCLTDIIIYELLSLKFPLVSSLIRNKPHIFIGSSIEGIYDVSSIHITSTMATNNHKRERILNHIDGMTEYKESKTVIISLLKFIFPQTDSMTQSYYYKRDLNRIQHPHSLIKLLQSDISTLSFSSRTVIMFITKPEERERILSEFPSPEELFSWLNEIIMYFNEVKINDPVGLTQLLVEKAQWSRDLVPAIFHNSLGYFLIAMINHVPENEIKLDVLKYVVKQEKSIATAEDALLQLLPDYGIWKDGTFYHNEEEAKRFAKPYIESEFNYSDLYELVKVWLATVKRVAKGPGLIETQDNVISIFYRWGQLNNNDYSIVQEYFNKNMNNKKWLIKAVNIFRNFTWQSGEYPHILPPDFDQVLLRVLPGNEDAKRISKVLKELKTKIAKQDAE